MIKESSNEKSSQMNKNRIYFSNGSVIKATQSNVDDTIRSRRAKLFPEYYDYDAICFDEEEFNKIVSKFGNK